MSLYRYFVTVEAETEDQSAEIMALTIGDDIGVDFDYTIDYDFYGKD